MFIDLTGPNFLSSPIGIRIRPSLPGPGNVVDTGQQLFITGLAHGLQHHNLFAFAIAINTKMIEIHGGHGNSIHGRARRTATREHGSCSAKSKDDDEFVNAVVHIHWWIEKLLDLLHFVVPTIAQWLQC